MRKITEKIRVLTPSNSKIWRFEEAKNVVFKGCGEERDSKRTVFKMNVRNRIELKERMGRIETEIIGIGRFDAVSQVLATVQKDEKEG